MIEPHAVKPSRDKAHLSTLRAIGPVLAARSMIDTSMLPRNGETVILPDDTTATVAWCSGWTWPLTEPEPTRLYAQAIRADVLTPELRVIAARDATGVRFWIAERRG